MCTYLFGNLALTTLCTYKLGLAFCFCKSCGPLGLPWAVREICNTQRAIAFIWRPSPGTMRQIYTGYLFPTSLRGVLVSDSVSRLRVLRRLLLRRLLLRRLRLLSHTTLSHTIFHHAIFHHTIFHPHLCHTPSFAHHFVTHHLSPHHLSHTTGSGGALGRAWSPVTPRYFAWHTRHLVTSTFVSSGRRATWCHPLSFCVTGVAGMALMALGWLWWRAWARLVAGVAAQLCVAGVALGDIHLRFAWQAWHLVTSAFVLRGRCGTSWHPPAFCVAVVALGDIRLRFAWQAWHLWHWVGGLHFLVQQ